MIVIDPAEPESIKDLLKINDNLNITPVVQLIIVSNNQNIVCNTKVKFFRFKLKDYLAARIGELL